MKPFCERKRRTDLDPWWNAVNEKQSKFQLPAGMVKWQTMRTTCRTSVRRKKTRGTGKNKTKTRGERFEPQTSYRNEIPFNARTKPQSRFGCYINHINTFTIVVCLTSPITLVLLEMPRRLKACYYPSHVTDIE